MIHKSILFYQFFKIHHPGSSEDFISKPKEDRFSLKKQKQRNTFVQSHFLIRYFYPAKCPNLRAAPKQPAKLELTIQCP